MAETIPIKVSVGPQRPEIPTSANTVDADKIYFPPFPAPPPGVTIMPRKNFKPAGIQMAVGDTEPGYIECDGTGVPTAELRVKHSLTDAEQRKRVKRTKVTLPNGATRRLLWFEEWEDDESSRKTDIDPYVRLIVADCAFVALTDTTRRRSFSRVDRLRQACYDFKAGRPWPLPTTDVSKLWDHVRITVVRLLRLTD